MKREGKDLIWADKFDEIEEGRIVTGLAEPVQLVRPWLDQLLNLVTFFKLIYKKL